MGVERENTMGADFCTYDSMTISKLDKSVGQDTG